METPKIADLADKINNTLAQPQFPKLPKIEFDLLMQHVRELYDELEVINNGAKEPVKKKRENPGYESLQPEELLIRRTIHTNEHFLLNDIHPRQEEPPQKTPVQQSTHMGAVQTLDSPKASLNESIKSPGSLNEKLKVTSVSEVHKAISSKHLKDMIDLNKKHVLVNELFKGNKENYSRAIAYIDQCADYNAAETFIGSQLGSNPDWNEHSSSAQLFMSLVKSKFGRD